MHHLRATLRRYRPGRWYRLRIAIAVPSLIGALWWLNGRECLLASVIYRLAGDDRTQSDIFLPDAAARLIMPVSTSLLLLAVGLVLWRQLAQRWRPHHD